MISLVLSMPGDGEAGVRRIATDATQRGGLGAQGQDLFWKISPQSHSGTTGRPGDDKGAADRRVVAPRSSAASQKLMRLTAGLRELQQALRKTLGYSHGDCGTVKGHVRLVWIPII